jgi:hypothetical protein
MRKPMEKKNREQRRREKYGHAGGATKEPWPQSEANPAFGQAGPVDEAGNATGDVAADADAVAAGDESADGAGPEPAETKPTKPASVARRKKA